MSKRIHNVCPVCGSILDAGERCECGEQGTRVEVKVQVRQIPATQATKRRSGKKKWKPKPGTEAYRIHQRGL